MSNSSRPHGLQPTRLLHPWDFPSKSTGVGCHLLLHPQAGNSYITDETQYKMQMQKNPLLKNEELQWDFPGGPVVKNLSSNARDTGSICICGRFPGEGNGNPLQCSCLGNTTEGGTWRAIVQRVKESTRVSN